MSTTIHDDTTTRFEEFIISTLGFTPEESLVVFPLTPSGVIARIDLEPVLANSKNGLFDQIADHLSDCHSTEVVVAYFTEQDPAALAGTDAHLTAALDAVGIIRRTTLMFDNVPRGIRRHDLGVIPPATPASRATARRALCAATTELAHYTEAFRCLINGKRPPVSMIGKAATTLESLQHRDAIVVWMTDPSLDFSGPAAQLPSEATTVLAMEQLLSPAAGRKPGRTVDDHTELLTLIAAHMDGKAQAPARTLLALIAWWSGNGALAARHLEEALSADPTYRFAQLLAVTVDRAIPPGWAA